MADLSMKDYQHKGLDFDRKILTNMLSLWSPYIEIKDITFQKATSNPSHNVEVLYDFTPFVNSYTIPEGYKLSDILLYKVPKYIKLYPVIENMDVNVTKAEDLINYGITDEVIYWEEGHYYMGGGSQTPLIIYIDEREKVGNDIFYIAYVLNLFRGDGGINFKDYKWKELGYPWFNIYKIPIRKLSSDYKLDITDWIDGAKKASFMNWKGNPL